MRTNTKSRSAFLNLERLEDRWVPATARFAAGVLTITNTNNVAAQTVTITQTAANTFSLTGNAAGTYTGVTLINYVGSNAADTVNLLLGGLTYQGGFIFDGNAGNDTLNIQNGTIQGNVTGITDLGNDTVNIGNAAGAVVIQGTTNLTNTSGTDTLTIASSAAVTFNGDVTATSFPNFAHTSANNVIASKSFSLNNTLTTAANNISFATGTGTFTVGTNLSITTGNAADGLSIGTGAQLTVNGNMILNTNGGGDTVTMGVSTAPTIVGNQLSVFLGEGNDTFTINGANAGTGFFKINLQGEAGNDVVTFNADASTVWQASVNLGDGDDTFTLGNGAAAGETADIIGTVNGGSGLNTFTTPIGSDWTTGANGLFSNPGF